MFALDPRADILRLRPHLLHQPRPLDRLGEARIVFDVRRGHQLSAGLEAGQHQRFQERARGIDRRRIGGRPRANDDEALMRNPGRGQLASPNFAADLLA